jgi:GT2 family glycosyltransferase
MSLTVAVCIATHNRREELARTLDELARLAPAPDAVLVAADGCTDGTAEWLRERHPHVRVLVHEQPLGSIPSRNELAAACKCDVFVSLDDDSHPLEADFITHVRELFARRPKLAIASFPQRTDEFPETLTATDFGPAREVGSYANSGAAIRRSVFLDLGGYPDFFRHAYEEPDFALRCISADWEVRFEPAVTIRHRYSNLNRNGIRIHHQHARNELWSVFMRCPAPQLFAVALFRIARQFGYARKQGLDWIKREPAWWVQALAGLPQCLRQRCPIPWPSYRRWLDQLRRGAQF